MQSLCCTLPHTRRRARHRLKPLRPGLGMAYAAGAHASHPIGRRRRSPAFGRGVVSVALRGWIPGSKLPRGGLAVGADRAAAARRRILIRLRERPPSGAAQLGIAPCLDRCCRRREQATRIGGSKCTWQQSGQDGGGRRGGGASTEPRGTADERAQSATAAAPRYAGAARIRVGGYGLCCSRCRCR